MQATTITIHATPAQVSVSDERGHVDGADVRVQITDEDGTVLVTAMGEVIPQEGDSPACWAGDVYRQLTYHWDRELADALDGAACRGAAGIGGMWSNDQ